MKRILLSLLLFGLVESCQQQQGQRERSISDDPKFIQTGMQLFEEKCSTCHGFDTEGIGPELGGVTREAEPEWIKKFIKSPTDMVKGKDPRAMALHQQYKVYMPGFVTLSEHELNCLLSYMHQFKKKRSSKVQDSAEMIANPIEDSLGYADSSLEIEYLTQIPASTEKFRLALINKLANAGKTERLFINDQRGVLYELRSDETEKYLDMRDYFPNFKDKPGLGSGFGSFAVHSDFSENGLFYTSHSENKNKIPADFPLPDSIPVEFQWVVNEWKAESPGQRSFNGKYREILRIDFPSHLHGIQEIAFKPSISKSDNDYGLLYVTVGDGGAVIKGYQQVVMHEGTKIWGTILRIDPLGKNSDNGRYGIPPSNPYANNPKQLREIWAYGFRNPNRISWDSSGQMYASDIGHKIVEEVNRISPGKFYGWPIREGTFSLNPFGNHSLAYPLPENENELDITYPIFQYDHDDGTAISGGFVSQGNTLKGQYIFGDITQGTVFVGDFNATTKRNIQKLSITMKKEPTSFSKLTQSSRVDLRLGQDRDGKLYFFTKADGKIYRAVD
ncbi:MAG: PQQ-dependent sugar dehydrogenase [Cyclobacteriaceae bacterium]